MCLLGVLLVIVTALLLLRVILIPCLAQLLLRFLAVFPVPTMTLVVLISFISPALESLIVVIYILNPVTIKRGVDVHELDDSRFVGRSELLRLVHGALVVVEAGVDVVWLPTFLEF